VTPENEAHLDEMLEQMWVLGVPWLRPTQVVISGAAARGGDWSTSTSQVRRTIAEFEQRRGTQMRIDLRGDAPLTLARPDRVPPASLLVRPAGQVRIDSLRPFAYGNAARDGLAGCWERITREWRDPVIDEWAAGIGKPADLGAAEPVPYLDEDLDPAQSDIGPAARDGASRIAPLPPLVQPKAAGFEEDIAESRSLVRDLALARPYRKGPVREGGDRDAPVLRHESGGYVRLNHTAALVMRALEGGTPGLAARVLAQAYPDIPEDPELAALGATRDLMAAGVILPAGARGPMPDDPGASDLPGLEPQAV
jgi:hypothetical protein